MTTDLTYDEIRATQPSADSIVGSLMVGFMVEGMKNRAALAKLHAFATERGLALFFGGGDAENTLDEHLVTLYPWLVGKELVRSKGGVEQESGFDYTPGGRLDSMKDELHARARELASFAKDNEVSVSACETFLVARGGLALALLLKGEWIEAPNMDDEDDPDAALDEWREKHGEPFASASSGTVGYRYGTKGPTQEPSSGGVHGICIAGADATAEVVHFSAAKDAELDARLAEAGITKPRYFLITQYD